MAKHLKIKKNNFKILFAHSALDFFVAANKHTFFVYFLNVAVCVEMGKIAASDFHKSREYAKSSSRQYSPSGVLLVKLLAQEFSQVAQEVHTRH